MDESYGTYVDDEYFDNHDYDDIDDDTDDDNDHKKDSYTAAGAAPTQTRPGHARPGRAKPGQARCAPKHFLGGRLKKPAAPDLFFWTPEPSPTWCFWGGVEFFNLP